MNSKALVSSGWVRVRVRVWVWVRVHMRLPALVAPMMLLVVLSCVGCGGSGSSSSQSSPQDRKYVGQGQPWVADFNQDGKLDILTSGDSGVTMNLGRGDGTFHLGIPITVPPGFHVNAIADFNGDGKPDFLATTNCLS